MSWLQQSENGSGELRPSSLPVPDVKTVAIGINERGKISPKPQAKIKCFKPRAVNGRLELSTFCVDGLDEDDRWNLLDLYSDKAPIPGRAELTPGDIQEAGLQMDPDWDPERHVNVLGWPDDEGLLASAAQVLLGRQAFMARPNAEAA